MKQNAILIVVAGLVLFAWLALHRHSSRDQKAQIPRLAPDFSLTDISGRPLRLTEYRGKVVILDFWATWCEPCKEEVPHFIEMQNKYSVQGLQIIGISMDDDEPPVRQFQQEFKMNYPVAVGSPSLADQYGGILGLPITFVIDREGRIISKHIGATKTEVFEKEIQHLL